MIRISPLLHGRAGHTPLIGFRRVGYIGRSDIRSTSQSDQRDCQSQLRSGSPPIDHLFGQDLISVKYNSYREI